ncbi:MAG: hypothetical protein JSS10_01270 [Verrucomicrobia bacterium]|nr:hypothetical protein [Verrucomicrobiota bacterium]
MAAFTLFSSLRETSSVFNLAELRAQAMEPRIRLNLKEEKIQQNSLAVKPLPLREVEPLQSPGTKNKRQISPDIYRASVRCMNQIIETISENQENAQLLFTEAEQNQKLLPQHGLKAVAALAKARINSCLQKFR